MSSKISRRQLAVGAVAGAAFAQISGVTEYPDLKNPGLDPVAWTKQRYDSAPLRLTFKAGNRKDAEAWQKKLRPKIIELIGGFPETPAPLNPQSIESRDFPTHKRERFLFTSRPGVLVSAYLVLPKTGTAPYPTVICVPGHGRGADDIVGIDDKGRDRTSRAGYQFDFALQMAEKGMAAVAIEPMAFGCRRDAITKKKGLGNSACQPSAGAALLLGETMIGWRVYDVMRTLDWIATRPDLDKSRVACTGISGGGTCTLFATAIDTRIQAALVSGYLNTFRDSILSLSHCIDNYVPGILNWAEMYDVAGLIAPRPLFAESGAKDNIFPIEASKESFSRVKKVYEAMGASDRIAQEIFDGPHEFHGAQGIPFLAKHLRA